MALPTNATPVYNLIIPSSKKEYKYRPFLVREEKALLLAQQSEDISVMTNTVRDVIKSCCKNTVDIDNLTFFDIEYIFLKLRTVSVGETVELQFNCDTDHGDDAVPCKSVVNLDTAFVETPENHTNNISLYDNVGIMFKYPSLDIIKKMTETQEDDIEKLFEIIIECINYIYNGDEIFKKEDCTKEELLDFLNNLQSKQFEQVQKFFSSMPNVKVKAAYTCPVCKTEYQKDIVGLASFF